VLAHKKATPTNNKQTPEPIRIIVSQKRQVWDRLDGDEYENSFIHSFNNSYMFLVTDGEILGVSRLAVGEDEARDTVKESRA
jgi:hypothetical protein